MPNPNAVVSTITRFDPPLDRPPVEILRGPRGLSVELADGRRARLDPADPRSPGLAGVLTGLERQRLPVYLEIDPGTETITRLLIPHVTRVVRVERRPDGTLDVAIERSHARHTLRPESADFETIERGLRRALESRDAVVLTEDDAHEILDLRAYVPGPEGPPVLPPLPVPQPPVLPGLIQWILDRLRRLFRPPWFPPWLIGCISATRAQQAFDAMNATSCDPLTVPPPCIPFLYPDDGCWGRAHEMCRRMIAMGLKPKKVWIQGWLQPATRNNPNCKVSWGWHVAPTLCVRGPRWFQTRRMVIDPALFATPVTKDDWKAVQNDPSATLTDSSADIFYLWGGLTDPTYQQTNQVLATYRLQLQARSVQVGPPPYAHCP